MSRDHARHGQRAFDGDASVDVTLFGRPFVVATGGVNVRVDRGGTRIGTDRGDPAPRDG